MQRSAFLSFTIVFGALSAISAFSQTAPARAVPQSFEVASVRPNVTGSESRRASTAPGGRFTATNVSLRLMISRAFGVPEAQIERGPNWLDSEKYDIEARANTPLEMTQGELRPCLQALLAERFRLKSHHETREGSVLLLVVAKNGAKLKQHLSQSATGIGASSDSGKTSITATKVGMSRLAEYLSGQTGRPVIDNTGLKGEYDFSVEWTTVEGAPEPSIFAALEEQLGLKLAAARGPIDFIVIDAAEKASAN